MKKIIKELSKKYGKKYSEYNTERNRIEDKIEERNKQIKRLEKKRERLNCPYWTDILLRPILEEVAKETKELIWDFMGENKNLIPMGLRSAVSVFGDNDKGKTIAMLVFTPNNLSEGKINYDLEHLPYDNTIAGMNGIGTKQKEVESIKELVIAVRNHIKEEFPC